MFSINEIWKCISQRLVEMDVMADPDEGSDEEAELSSELENDFDFVEAANKRSGAFFKGSAGKKKASLASMMKKKDYMLINRMLELVAGHHKQMPEHTDGIKKLNGRNELNRKELKALTKDYEANKVLREETEA